MPSQSQVEFFIGLSQVNLKSSNLRLESDLSQVMLLESPTSADIQHLSIFGFYLIACYSTSVHDSF